jgi:anti-anti-sigma factor
MTSLRTLDRAVELAPGDHASWAYDDPSDLREACRDYFTEGAHRGERLMYVGGGDLDVMADHLSGLRGRDRMLERGQLSLHTLASAYGGTNFDPQQQIETMLQFARAAIDEGYTGLRILGDSTDLAADPRLADALLAYESAVDVVPSTTRTTALCAVDIRRTPPPTWRALSALHRLQHAPDGAPTFALKRDGDTLHLSGEVDVACATDLRNILRCLGAVTSGELVLDLRGLGFIDVAGTRALASFQQAMSTSGRVLRFSQLSSAARRTFPIFGLVEMNA